MDATCDCHLQNAKHCLSQPPVHNSLLLGAVMPGTKLQEHIGSEKAWVWSAVDFADESQKMELFCIRFASKERQPSAPLHVNARLPSKA